MSWFNRFTKKDIIVESVPEPIPVLQPVKTTDYPKQQYYAYWEEMEGNVRFYHRQDGRLLEAHQIMGRQAIDNLIRDKMESYRRA